MTGYLDTNGKPVFVPVALRYDEAVAMSRAARSAFHGLYLAGQAAEHGSELARAMVTIATAVDKVTPLIVSDEVVI